MKWISVAESCKRAEKQGLNEIKGVLGIAYLEFKSSSADHLVEIF